MQACTYCQSRDVTITDETPAHRVNDNRPAWGATLRRTTLIPATVDFSCNDCGRSGTVDA